MADLNYPTDLKYAETDEWVRIEGDIAIFGISDYAQDQLNDLVYAEFKDVGTKLTAGDPFGEVESVKAASEVYALVSGEIVEVNDELEGEPEIINEDPYGNGWMIKVKISDQGNLDSLMDADAYKQYCESR